MAEDSSRDHDSSQKKDADKQRVQRSDIAPLSPLATELPLPSAAIGSLFGDPRLNGRGNQPVKNTVMQRMQQTHGNRAVQRMLVQRTSAPGTVPVQRATQSDDANVVEQAETQGPAGEQMGTGTVGDTPVQREASGEPVPVQRQDPPAASADPTPGVGMKNTFTHQFPIKLNKEVGPFMLKQLSIKGDVNYQEMADVGNKGGAQTGDPRKDASKVQARGGVVHGGEQGIQAEVKKKYEDVTLGPLGSWTPSIKDSGKWTSRGGEVALEGALSGKVLSFAMKVSLVRYTPASGDKESQVEFFMLTPNVQITFPEGETVLVGSLTYKFSAKTTISLDVTPNYKAIAKWVGQKFLELAASELAIAGGMVAIGAATLAAGIVTAGLGSEVREKVDASLAVLDGYVNGYQAGMTGRQVSNASGVGFGEGMAKANEILTKGEEKVPRDTLMEEARRRNLHAEAYDLAVPMLRERVFEQYRKEHWFEQMVYGDNGPGMRQLRTVFDAAMSRPGRR